MSDALREAVHGLMPRAKSDLFSCTATTTYSPSRGRQVGCSDLRPAPALVAVGRTVATRLGVVLHRDRGHDGFRLVVCRFEPWDPR